MARETYKLVTARKPHTCTEHSYHAIQPGDLYLSAWMPPEHECSRWKKWTAMRVCLRCCETYGLHNSDTRRQLAAHAGKAVV